MLANPGHSRVILLNPARSELGEVSAELVARRIESLSLLPAAQELFGVAVWAIGEYQSAQVPERLREITSVLDVGALSLWNDQRFTTSLAASNVGVICLGGAWLEEEVFIAALEGARLGYDMRMLTDLSIARREGDRSLVLDRRALHGVLAMTVRQALLEWAVCLNDPVVKRSVQQLLS